MIFFPNLKHHPDILITILIIYFCVYFLRDKISLFFNNYFYLYHKGYKYLLEKNYEYIILNNNIDNMKQNYEETTRKNLLDYVNNVEQFYSIKIENLKLSLNITKYIYYIKYLIKIEQSIVKNLNKLFRSCYIEIYSCIFD